MELRPKSSSAEVKKKYRCTPTPSVCLYGMLDLYLYLRLYLYINCKFLTTYECTARKMTSTDAHQCEDFVCLIARLVYVKTLTTALYNRRHLVWLHSCNDIDSYKNSLSCVPHVHVYMYQLTRPDTGEASHINVEFLIDWHSHSIQLVVCMSSNWRLLGSHYKVSKLR